MTCTDTYCSGTGTTDVLFKQLQTLLNQIGDQSSLMSNLSFLVIDGKIGVETSKLFDAVATLSANSPGFEVMTQVQQGGSAWRDIAGNADSIVPELQKLAALRRIGPSVKGGRFAPPSWSGGSGVLAPVVSSGSRSGPSIVIDPATGNVVPGGAPASAAGAIKSSWVPWLVGGTVILTLGGIVIYAASHRHKTASTSVSGVRFRRRRRGR